jgi:hypothetical protein
MMYTKDEVETILEFVNDDMRRSVEKELANANHVTALLMRMLMAQVTPPPPPDPPALSHTRSLCRRRLRRGA